MDRAMIPQSTRPGVPRTVSIQPLATIAAGLLVATAAAAGSGWEGVLSVLWLALVAVAWRHPVVGLTVIAIAVPFEQHLSLPTLVGTVTAMEYTVWAVTAGSAPGLLRTRRLALDRVGVMHLAVIVALVASIAAGDVRVSTWWDVVQGWLLALLVYLIARAALSDARARLVVVSALAVGVVTNAVVALWQRGTGAGPESFVVSGAVRVFGTFLHPNTLASYLAFVLPLLLAVSLGRETPTAWLWRCALAAGSVTIVMTQSRGGMLALGAAAVVLLAMATRPIQRWAAVAAVGVAMVVATTGTIDRLPGIDRFTTVAPTAGPAQVAPETWGQLERQAHWGAAWAMLRSDPSFGVGAGEFSDAFREHTPDWRFRVGRGHAHNGYLQLGAEAGVPGMLAFAGWVGTILVALWRRLIRSSGLDHVLAAGALGGAVAWAINNVFEYQDVPSIPVMFAMVVAIGLGRLSAPGTSPSRGEPIGDAP
jgi:O-antigen ligase